VIGNVATGQIEGQEQDDRNPAVVELERLGGKKGGVDRVDELPAE
jgi:hypothetical protein